MSIKAMTYVWEHSAQRGSALLMMLAIADMANDDGDCWPGVSRLATKTRMSERNAQKTIRKLQDDGELLVFENQGTETAHGWTNRYRVVMDGVSLATPPTRKKVLRGERGDTSGVNHTTPQGVNGVTPKPSVETKEETKPQRTALRPAAELNPIKDAIVNAFGWSWERMSKTEKGRVQKTAAELFDANQRAENVPALYACCKRKYEQFGPNALCGVVSEVTSKPGKTTGTDLTALGDSSTWGPEQWAQYNQLMREGQS